MSTLNKGEVSITLDGTEYTLKPTVSAYNILSHMYDGERDLYNKIAAGNQAAIRATIRHGLGWGDDKAKKIPELLLKTGLNKVKDPLSDYAFRLLNGGMSVEEWISSAVSGDSGGSDEDDVGNEYA